MSSILFKVISLSYSDTTFGKLRRNHTWEIWRGWRYYHQSFQVFEYLGYALDDRLDSLNSNGGGTVVNFGCGKRMFDIQAAKRFRNLTFVGISYSQKFSDCPVSGRNLLLKFRLWRLGERLRSVVGDAHDKTLYTAENGLALGSASLVVDYYGVLTYSPDKPLAVQRAYDVLAPGGLLYVHTFIKKYQPLEVALQRFEGFRVLSIWLVPSGEYQGSKYLLMKVDPGDCNPGRVPVADAESMSG